MNSLNDLLEFYSRTAQHMPVTIDDVVKNSCIHRFYLQAMGYPHDTSGKAEDVILRKIEDAFRCRVHEYLLGAFPQDWRPFPSDRYVGVIDLRWDGAVKDTLIDIHFCHDGAMPGEDPPAWMGLAAAAKAHYQELDKACVLLINRNTSAWQAYDVVGSFEEPARRVAEEMNYIIDRIEDPSLPGEGVETATSCRRCPFSSGSCSAPRTGALKSKGGDLLRYSVNRRLTDALDAYLISLNNRPSTRKTHCIHPSEFSTSPCDRRIAYSILGTERKESISPHLRRIFDMGHSVHDVIQDSLSLLYEDFEPEVKAVNKALKIHGHCDGVRQGQGYEIKSINNRGYESLTKPKGDHIKQAAMYGRALDLDEIEYLYVNKDTGDIRSFTVDVKPSVWHPLATRAESIHATLGRGDLPPLTDKEYLCTGCPFLWTCRVLKPGIGASFR